MCPVIRAVPSKVGAMQEAGPSLGSAIPRGVVTCTVVDESPSLRGPRRAFSPNISTAKTDPSSADTKTARAHGSRQMQRGADGNRSVRRASPVW